MLMGKTRRETELLYIFLFLQFALSNNRFGIFFPIIITMVLVKRSTTDRTFVPFCAKVILLRVCQWKNLGKWDILYKNHIRISFLKLKLKIWHTFNPIRFGRPTVFFNSKSTYFFIFIILNK